MQISNAKYKFTSEDDFIEAMEILKSADDRYEFEYMLSLENIDFEHVYDADFVLNTRW